MSHQPKPDLGLVAPPGGSVHGNGGDDPVTFRIVIEYHAKSDRVATQAVDLVTRQNGIGERMLCYSLLELARDAVFKAHLATLAGPPSKIAVVDGQLPPFHGKG